MVKECARLLLRITIAMLLPNLTGASNHITAIREGFQWRSGVIAGIDNPFCTLRRSTVIGVTAALLLVARAPDSRLLMES